MRRKLGCVRRKKARPTARPRGSRRTRAGLTREAIVQRALAIGDEEGLDAVSLRRIAADFGVTPMAIYRHVRDKEDLQYAMLDATLAEADLTAGIRATMPWPEQLRRGLQNAVTFLTARRVALPLQIAYQGPLTPRIARGFEDSFALLLRGGFPPRDAARFARLLPVVIAGLLLLRRDAQGATFDQEKLRRAIELQLLELPEDQFPLLRRHSHVIAEAFFSPGSDGGLNEMIEVLVAGMEQAREKAERSPRASAKSRGATPSSA